VYVHSHSNVWSTMLRSSIAFTCNLPRVMFSPSQTASSCILPISKTVNMLLSRASSP
jgi:hypothetical protein